jgi:hypothetical protein
LGGRGTDRRKAVVQSILDSERSFIDSLQPFIKLYSEDMFLELTELHEMFGRVMVIYNYHHKIVKVYEYHIYLLTDLIYLL